jgi:hypothetical protein
MNGETGTDAHAERPHIKPVGRSGDTVLFVPADVEQLDLDTPGRLLTDGSLYPTQRALSVPKFVPIKPMDPNDETEPAVLLDGVAVLEYESVDPDGYPSGPLVVVGHGLAAVEPLELPDRR